jgi:hypothetical protein
MVMAERSGAASQGGAWTQLVCAAKLLWNCTRYLLHRHPSLSYYFGK